MTRKRRALAAGIPSRTLLATYSLGVARVLCAMSGSRALMALAKNLDSGASVAAHHLLCPPLGVLEVFL